MKMDEKGESTSSEESTNVFSSKFNPLTALYSEKTVIPVPEAPLYDNVSKFESVVLRGTATKQSKDKKLIKKEGNVRRFLPHQLPIKTDNSERQHRYSEKNVFNKMQKANGPLGMLYQYMENRVRVKVYTRNEREIRGYIEAFIAAFDKHWNLALEDCLETWSRKVKRKAPAAPGGRLIQPVPNSDTFPKVVVKRRTKKMEELERHVPQLLVRGEQVVMVVKLD